VNADDWGKDAQTTDRISECFAKGVVSATSAMVFMKDSERAAQLARSQGIETGLHLNFTSPFSDPRCPAPLIERQQKVAHHLRRHRYAPVVFHPLLVRSFEYVVAAQFDEYRHLYGGDPEKIDGEHHMHLCSNVLFQRLIPSGMIVRRNFYFEQGERSQWNRIYRRMVDNSLAKRHRLVDYFFSVSPIQPVERLLRFYALANDHIVEMETHPVLPEEYDYLIQGEFRRHVGEVRISPPSAVAWNCDAPMANQS
jgi:predicted glycoside hydrolase/deacetylase ChbG (UPF0249 family)